MVKLRSGFVYIDNKLFNTFVEKFNTFINNINFKIINDTNGKLFKKIIKLNKSLKLDTNQFGKKYFKYKKSHTTILMDNQTDYTNKEDSKHNKKNIKTLFKQ